MKKYLILITILFYVSSYSQSKWISTVELDFVFPNKKDYFYNDSTNRIFDTELRDDGFLLNSFGIQADYNYMLLKKISIGALVGFQTQSKPDYSMLKLGGILKYYFIDSDNSYLFLQDANNFSLNKNKFKTGNNLRLGIGFPFFKKKEFNINGNFFFEQNFFRLDGTNPLLNLADERPRTLTVKSFGISLGIKF